MAASGKWVRADAFRRAFAQRSRVYATLAIVVSFMLMGGLRVLATPLVDNLGAFPDEVYHFVRSLKRARELAQNFGLASPRFSAPELTALGTRGDDLCGLGISDAPQCVRNTDGLPAGSGEIRGSGVYLAHGLVQLLLPVSDTHSRLLLGRMAALGVGLALAWVAYRLGCALFADRAIALAAAALVVLLPSVNGIFSALSTEGPALLAVALLLWAAVAVYLRGFSAERLLGLGLALLACIFTKVTALAVAPVAAMLLLHRVGFRWRGLLLAALIALTALAAAIGMMMMTSAPAGSAHWYFDRAPAMVPIHGMPAELAKQVSETKPDGVVISPPLGRVAISTSGSIWHGPDPSVVQFLPAKFARRLAGKRLTVGAWMQAPPRILINAPEVILASDNGSQSTLPGRELMASGHWQFVAYEVQLPAQVLDVGVRLRNEGAAVLWDGVTLAAGSYLASGHPPSYDDATATTGEWGGARFKNLLKNGSGEDAWYGAPGEVKAFVHIFGTSTLAHRLDGQVFSLYDFERTGAGYLAGLRAIFVTFWGSFVGGDWPGLARWHYGVAAGVLVLAGLGWLRRIRRRRHTIPKAMPTSVAFVFLQAALLYLLIGVARAEVSAEWVPPLFYATARHVLPAITPVVLLTVGGLAQLFSTRVNRAVLALLVLGVFLANTWMLLRVELPYFSCPLEILWACTAL
jgi:hypothetical protein